MPSSRRTSSAGGTEASSRGRLGRADSGSHASGRRGRRRLHRAGKTAATAKAAVLAGRDVRTRPRLVDGQTAAGSAFSRRPSTNPGPPPDEFSSADRGRERPNTIIWKAPRARFPGRAESRRRPDQHRRHGRGGGDGGLGARPPSRSTPPLSSWRRCCHSPAGRRLATRSEKTDQNHLSTACSCR